MVVLACIILGHLKKQSYLSVVIGGIMISLLLLIEIGFRILLTIATGLVVKGCWDMVMVTSLQKLALELILIEKM